ncbi:PREDICTED: ras-related protein Rab-31, partial [Fulmarus glacialis]|uniref:ras-related protein Rab-31 n=1 Tax=Fulmarus glacialis TaxID=30455 RepID=UPI00051CAC40
MCLKAQDFLVQDTGVGKSSIVCRFVQDHFDHNISPTIGASFMTKTVPCGNELHKFLIWDTAGQERLRMSGILYPSLCRFLCEELMCQDSLFDASGFCLCFSPHPDSLFVGSCCLKGDRNRALAEMMNWKCEVDVLVEEHEYEGALNPVSIAPVLTRPSPGDVSCCWLRVGVTSAKAPLSAAGYGGAGSP